MTKVILIRHGQTVWNLEMKYQGHTDIELTARGLRQASLVAERLKEYEISAVYSSDLTRATKTAEYIANQYGLPVNISQDFRELCFGEWEGLTYDGIQERWSGTMKELFQHPADIRIPGGETFQELQERATHGLSQVIKQHAGQTVAIVSHGGTIRTLFCSILNIHLNHLWNIRQDNTAVNIIDYYPETTVVSLVNDTHHLKAEKLF